MRNGRLQKLLQSAGSGRAFYAQHVEHRRREFFTEVCKLDLEGIVAKRKDSTYRDDGTGWLKIKNPAHSQAEGRQELLTRKK